MDKVQMKKNMGWEKGKKEKEHRLRERDEGKTVQGRRKRERRKNSTGQEKEREGKIAQGERKETD